MKVPTDDKDPFASRPPFVGRSDVVDRLKDQLDYGQSTILIGGRRTGKTTLIRQLSSAPLGRPVVVSDVAGWDISTEASGLGALLSALEGLPETRRGTGSRDDLVEAVDRLQECAILIDEADRLLQVDWGPSFFSFLRWMDDTHYRTRVSIVLAGGPVLAEFRDPNDRGSPPLNIAEYEFIEPLHLNAIAELNSILPEPEDPQRLLQWTGGNAWLATRILSLIWRGFRFEDAAEKVHDHAVVQLFPVWQRQAGRKCLELLRSIPEEGLERSRILKGDLARYRPQAMSGRCIGLMRLEGGRLKRGPEPFFEWLSSSGAPSLEWDLAISYASEDVSIARELYEQLRKRFRVFFAPAESGALWGTNLLRVLPNTYGVSARFVLVLSTDDYVIKHWTMLEFNSVARTHPDRILFLNMGRLPDMLPPELVYRGASEAELVGLIPALEYKLAQGSNQ